MHARRMGLRSLVSLVAPPLCVACGASAGRVEPLCADCRTGLRRRGYNQAERLAREVGARRGCPVVDCLERVGRTGTQVGRSRPERAEAIEGTVRVRAGARVPERALLVDDVITTGATIDACAAVLFAGGAQLIGG